MLCDCTDATDTVLYVVGDLDLLCFEGVSCSTKFEEWKMTQHDPAGTIEMKPLEVHTYIIYSKTLDNIATIFYRLIATVQIVTSLRYTVAT